MIDCHAHVFPPKVGAKLATAIGEEFNRAPAGDGSVLDLLEKLDRAGLGRAICHAAAIRPDQMIPANTWALYLKHSQQRLIPFGTIHPEHPEWESQLCRLERKGILGLKLHPDLSGIPLDSPLWLPVWESIQGRFTVVIHMGGTGPGKPTASRPRALRQILDDFPRLEVIAAHLGGLFWWEEVVHELLGRELFLDTAACPESIPDGEFKAIITRHDPRRLLFGSDYPLFDPKLEIKALDKRLKGTGLSLTTIMENGGDLIQSLDSRVDKS